MSASEQLSWLLALFTPVKLKFLALHHTLYLGCPFPSCSILSYETGILQPLGWPYTLPFTSEHPVWDKLWITCHVLFLCPFILCGKCFMKHIMNLSRPWATGTRSAKTCSAALKPEDRKQIDWGLSRSASPVLHMFSWNLGRPHKHLFSVLNNGEITFGGRNYDCTLKPGFKLQLNTVPFTRSKYLNMFSDLENIRTTLEAPKKFRTPELRSRIKFDSVRPRPCQNEAPMPKLCLNIHCNSILVDNIELNALYCIFRYAETMHRGQNYDPMLSSTILESSKDLINPRFTLNPPAHTKTSKFNHTRDYRNTPSLGKFNFKNFQGLFDANMTLFFIEYLSFQMELFNKVQVELCARTSGFDGISCPYFLSVTFPSRICVQQKHKWTKCGHVKL
ncbi:hypothetical protein B0H16DRAFT_1461325 [Mycena metata]|uniref:Uncharacterized protein n=1 Tax=Mycena metata TaxID=1033252 RepID=A0AAD7N7R3_9AGAR|nr:hypothetical protein B0H16DRAFT_1461325 [Mycena metata]